MSSNLKTIKVATQSGTVLAGKLFHSPSAQTIYIAVTGVEGNINNNPFYKNLGNTLVKNKIDFLVAHSSDAFNKVKAINNQTGKVEFYGAWNEDFKKSDEDVAAYIDYAEKQGYKNIILGGQSLGANKAIHYLANNEDSRIKKFFLLSPVNIMTLRNSIPATQKRIIFSEKKKGNDEKILPFKLFRWLRANVATAYNWLTDDTLNNVHPESRANFDQIRKIQHTGALLIGTHDGFAGGDAVTYLKNINNHFPSSNKNELVFIPNASHIYRRQEQEIADKVLETISNWQQNF